MDPGIYLGYTQSLTFKYASNAYWVYKVKTEMELLRPLGWADSTDTQFLVEQEGSFVEISLVIYALLVGIWFVMLGG